MATYSTNPKAAKQSAQPRFGRIDLGLDRIADGIERARAIIIATNATVGVDEGRICIWAYEKGSRLADDNTVVPGRRVAFFYNATTPAATYNTNATALFDAVSAAKRMWENVLGIRVQLVAKETKAFAEDKDKGRFMLGRGGWLSKIGVNRNCAPAHRLNGFHRIGGFFRARAVGERDVETRACERFYDRPADAF